MALSLLILLLVYFTILFIVSRYTSVNTTTESFYVGTRNSNWGVVAFGMIGTTLSGITFVSVPGSVGNQAFTYLQITLGYTIGYIVVAYLLLPLYYRLRLTSIYGYLLERFGKTSYKTGASFFLLARALLSVARLYLVVNILQVSILSDFGVPFELTAFLILVFILLYTLKGGVKTLIWTDTLQTLFMLVGLFACAIYILTTMNFSVKDVWDAMSTAGYTKALVFDPNSKLFFLKQLIAGAFITIAMTGLDQEMMQKSISIKSLKNAQKNMLSLSITIVLVISAFLVLGALLHLYAQWLGIQQTGDALFPNLALNYMPPLLGIIFIIGLISALFPSADGAITALTASFCLDIVGINRSERSEHQKVTLRNKVHLTLGLLFFILILVFKYINSQSMINVILSIAAYTYGPLLGMFTFGIFTSYKIKEKYLPLICVLGPIISFLLDKYQVLIFDEFSIGLEILLINGFIVFMGLFLIRIKEIKGEKSNLVS